MNINKRPERVSVRLSQLQSDWLKTEVDQTGKTRTDIVQAALEMYRQSKQVTLSLPYDLAVRFLDILTAGRYTESLKSMADLLEAMSLAENNRGQRNED